MPDNKKQQQAFPPACSFTINTPNGKVKNWTENTMHVDNLQMKMKVQLW